MLEEIIDIHFCHALKRWTVAVGDLDGKGRQKDTCRIPYTVPYQQVKPLLCDKR